MNFKKIEKLKYIFGKGLHNLYRVSVLKKSNKQQKLGKLGF